PLHRPLSRAFKGMLAVRIDEERIDRYVAERKAQEAANGTINRELTTLKRAFRLAKKLKRVASVPEIAMLAEATPRQGLVEQADPADTEGLGQGHGRGGAQGPNPSRSAAHGRAKPRARGRAALRGAEARGAQDREHLPSVRDHRRSDAPRGRRQALGLPPESV